MESQINKIIRKLIVEYLNNKKQISKNVTKNDVKKYLGFEKYIFDKKEDLKGRIGIVIGLAYTDYCGTTTTIDVNYFFGKGKLILSGSLGDVMEESATIALNYVKSNAKKYDINPELFEKKDIHIHFPEDALSKDGLSVGLILL